MPRAGWPSPRSARRFVPALLALAACLPASAAEKVYEDSRYDFAIAVPEPWAQAPLGAYVVPGVARAAWSGPSGSSIVAFAQEPGQAVSPRFLVDASAQAMKEKLGCTVRAAEVREVGGKKAMWMVVSGRGTGGALSGKGDVETVAHWVAVPREKDVVVLLLTCPAADYDARCPSFEAAIKGMKVGGKQSPEQAGAK